MSWSRSWHHCASGRQLRVLLSDPQARLQGGIASRLVAMSWCFSETSSSASQPLPIGATFGFGSLIGTTRILIDTEHPEILNENKLADQIGNLTLYVASRRLASQLFYLDGFPGRLAGLLDPTEAPIILTWLAELHAAWLLVKVRPERCWAKIIVRIPFQVGCS